MPRDELLGLVMQWWGDGWQLKLPAPEPKPPDPDTPPAAAAIAAAAGAAAVCVACGPTAAVGILRIEFWRAEVALKFPDNPHLLALLEEPWMAALLVEPVPRGTPKSTHQPGRFA